MLTDKESRLLELFRSLDEKGQDCFLSSVREDPEARAEGIQGQGSLSSKAGQPWQQ